MADDMGTFRIDVEIENPAAEGRRERLTNVLVDTGAELSWFPARTLESLGIRRLNMRIDPVSKTLVDAGPALAASAA